MKKAITFDVLFQLLFLELLSLSPLLIILGNIVPPFPLKIHQIGFGILFLISLLLVIKDIKKRWLAYIALFYLFVQLYVYQANIPDFIDFFFGPFVLIVMMDLCDSKNVPRATLLKYFKRFFYLLWLPSVIALLQYLELMPFTFWNADYVNYTFIGDKNIPRSNGLLYHGSELSIIIVMTILIYFFNKKNHVWNIFLLFLIGITTLYKALIICTLILIIYYFTIIRRDLISWWWRHSKNYIVSFSIIFLFLFISVTYNYFKSMHELTGYFFVPKILTGRGTIWNIYIDAVKEFSTLKILFGNGIGSEIDLFKTYANPDNFSVLQYDPNSKIVYDAHNTLFSVFINTGLVGILFFTHIFYKLYRKISNWAPSKKWNRRAYFGIVAIPLLTIGITIPLFKTAIYWAALSFMYFKWNDYNLKIQKLRNDC